MIEVKNCFKVYGKKAALNDVSLSFDKGIYGLLGENGAGKTTLLHILTGIIKPDRGQVLYNGKDIQTIRKEYNHALGYMPQYASYYKNFTVEEFLDFMCAMKKIPRKIQTGRIQTVLERVNLEDACKKKVGALSGGMRQRLGIAQAILNEPEILILDEPTAGLDPYERIQFRALLRELAKDKTILLATHITQDVEELAEWIIVLHQGKVLVCDPVEKYQITNLEEWFVSVIEHDDTSYIPNNNI